MEFRLLGPVQALVRGRPVDLSRRRERCLLALLLLDVGTVVPSGRLVSLLWGEDLPANPRKALQIHVSRLRSRLAAVGCGEHGVRLRTRGGGYLLEAERGAVDVHRFRDLVDRAREVTDPDGRRRMLCEALDLWRGAPLADTATDELRESVCVGLDELRLSALELRAEADLALGRHHDLVPEVTELVARHPGRERFLATLMVALYRSGRQGDALAAYERGRQRLADELGLDPGTRLRRLHAAILRGDDELAAVTGTVDGTGSGAHGADPAVVSAPPGVPTVPTAPALPGAPELVPAQLPADVPHFTGRAGHLAALDALLADGCAVRTAVVVGTGGVGKTALTVHWAHRNAHHFPDGQLFADLRGYANAPAAPAVHVLTQFLRALGVPHDRVPAEPDEQAALYRTLLAGRRMLVVLDNVRDAEHARPLLPGSPTCLTVVTSRNRLGGLVAREGATWIPLGVLDGGESRALLAALVGPERTRREASATDQLAALCAHLPLALRVAAASLQASPHRAIADYAAELVAGNRLAALDADDDEAAAVRAAFDLSYQRLDGPDQRLFRLLGLVPGPDVTAPAAAALAGVDVAPAAAGLRRLNVAHLCDERRPGRYSFHDLLRLYASARAQADDPVGEREAALDRLVGWYLDRADAAARLLYPQLLRLPREDTGAAGFAGPEDALSYLEDERANLVAAVRHAAEHGPRRAAWLLADALRGYFYLRRHTADWSTTAAAALAASGSEHDAPGQAASWFSLGQSHWSVGDHARAADHYRRALEHCRRAGWQDGEAAVLGSLGTVYRHMGRMREATDHLGMAMEISHRIGWTDGWKATLSNLGVVHCETGRLERAAECYRRALALCAAGRDESIKATILNLLGNVCHLLGRLDEAREHLARALEVNRRFGNQHGVATTLDSYAAVHNDAGQGATAALLAEEAYTVASSTNDRDTQAETLNTLGVVRGALGDSAVAARHHEEALQIARDTVYRHVEAAALVGLAVARRDLGDLDAARARAEEALEVSRACGFRVLEGQALTALATVHLGRGEPGQAAECCREAVTVGEATGHRLGTARALVVLGHAVHPGVEAAGVWARALDIFTAVGAATEADRTRTLVAATHT